MNVVLASDNFYFPYIYVAVKSLLDSNREAANLVVYYIQQDVEYKNLSLLLDLGKEYGRTVNIIKFAIQKNLIKYYQHTELQVKLHMQNFGLPLCSQMKIGFYI